MYWEILAKKTLSLAV